MKRVHVFISGQVQCIFFRAHIRDNAISLGLKGFVRNLPDGRVEAVFEGAEKDVAEILEFCKRGPAGAKVEDVEVKKETYTGKFENFEIKY